MYKIGMYLVNKEGILPSFEDLQRLSDLVIGEGVERSYISNIREGSYRRRNFKSEGGRYKDEIINSLMNQYYSVEGLDLLLVFVYTKEFMEPEGISMVNRCLQLGIPYLIVKRVDRETNVVIENDIKLVREAIKKL